MKFKVFEYLVKDKNIGAYFGTYTLKADCAKEKELKKSLKSRFVYEFEVSNIKGE